MLESVHQFREKELMPIEKDFLLQGKLETKLRHDLERRGRKAGFWALEVPQEYGGLDVGQLALCMIDEELFKHPAMFEFGGSPEPALYLCNEEQKKRFFYPIIAGEKHSCYAFTEPDAGSDFARIRTTARRDGDNWVINGTKTFISYVDDRPIFSNSHAVFEVTGQRAIIRSHGPIVRQDARHRRTYQHHWLQSNGHSIPQRNAAPGYTIIGHLRPLVHTAPYSMPGILLDHEQAAAFDGLLDGG